MTLICVFLLLLYAGWAPDPSQPKAAKRGSATVSFEDLSSALGPENNSPKS